MTAIYTTKKLLFLGQTHNLSYLLSQTKFCPAAIAACMSKLKLSSNAKHMVRNYCIFTILQLSHSPYFQLNCSFWGEPAIHHISAHGPNFALPLPLTDWVNQNGEFILVDYCVLFTVTFVLGGYIINSNGC